MEIAMKRFTFAQSLAAAIACLGIVVPPAALAAPPVSGGIADVALHDGGTLVGAVYSAEGLPQEGALVSLQTGGQEVAQAVTDQQGRFTAAGLKGGVYQIVTTEGVSTYRAWSAGTAPPAAENAALVVAGQTARGQHGGGLASWLSNPWVLAAIVATAIAVPIALNDDDSTS
jgi:hypothetical protein